uniref:Uncharacterized protein n=1 Tax=Oryzias sinensis TaxID=183150 RepID=A0A8C7WS16_9TELE
QISGKILAGDELLATVDGHWDGDVFISEKCSGQRELLWSPSPEVRSRRLKRRVVQMGEQEEFESERLWQHVTQAILDRDQVQATQEKFVLEDAQRKEAKERGDAPWTPRFFQQDPVTSEWIYKHTDTRPWDPEICLLQFEKDGVIQTQPRSQHGSLTYGHSWTSRHKVNQHLHPSRSSSNLQPRLASIVVGIQTFFR